MKKTKVFANYLPQYHEIKENNEWWGKGYTDWVATKNAVPLYKGHKQPKVPQNKNYYDLSDIETIRWQADLAKNYGIDGFAIYHYWFSTSQMLLEKPAELLLGDASINISFFFIWDNASWKRTWSNIRGANDWAPLYENNKTEASNGVLAGLEYGMGDDWRIHYNYLKKFFCDERYYKIDGMPVFGFFNQMNDPETIKKMTACWYELAVQDGFKGIYFIYKKNNWNVKLGREFAYEPEWSGWAGNNLVEKAVNRAKYKMDISINGPARYNYSTIWKRIIKNAVSNPDEIHGAFVKYDDSPRRGKKGRVLTGESVNDFRHYFSKLYKVSCEQLKDFLLITAWNEWGEGAYLEPDEENGYSYLQEIKHAIEENTL